MASVVKTRSLWLLLECRSSGKNLDLDLDIDLDVDLDIDLIRKYIYAEISYFVTS